MFVWYAHRTPQIFVRLDVLHFSIIQRWYVAFHLSKYVEVEDKKDYFLHLKKIFAFFKWEEKEGESMLKLN